MKAKTIFKVFDRHKYYSAINIFALCVGITLGLLIFLVLNYDYNHDRHVADHSKIYRVNSVYSINDNVDEFAIASPLLGPRLTEEIPEVESYARFSRSRKRIVKIGEELFYEEGLLFTDQKSIQSFDFELLLGDINNALSNPDELLLAETNAIAWFGSIEKAMNQVIKVNDKDLQIVGILKDLPANVHLQFTGLMSEDHDETKYEQYSSDNLLETLWVPSYYTYLKINEASDDKVVFEKCQDFIESYVYPLIRARGVQEDFNLRFVPLANTHYDTAGSYDMPTGDASFFSNTLIIGLIILLIIAINYSNLSMALLSTRIKELAMRKVLGASKASIVIQLLFESIFYVVISTVLAYGLTYFVLKNSLIEQILNRNLTFDTLLDPLIVAIVFLLAITLAILSAIYPAWIFSKTSIQDIHHSKKISNRLRSILISSQFIASMLVISSMILMKLQLSLVDNYALGFKEQPMMIVDISNDEMIDKAESFKNRLEALPAVTEVTEARLSGQDGLFGLYSISLKAPAENGELQEQIFTGAYISNNFTETFGVNILHGRDLQSNLALDKGKVLVNQALVKRMAWKDPIGKRFTFDENEYEVIGVTENFHFKSLKNRIEPLVLINKLDRNSSSRYSFHIALEPKLEDRGIYEVRELFENEFPSLPFQYELLENKLDTFYKEDQQEANLTASLGYVAVILAILGLVGLSSFEINKRLKEVGIRKVLGANFSALFFCLTKGQIQLILVASILAAPLCYLFISSWLNEYVYQIAILPNLLLACGISLLMVLFLSLLAISTKIVHASRLHPAEVLRNE